MAVFLRMSSKHRLNPVAEVVAQGVHVQTAPDQRHRRFGARLSSWFDRKHHCLATALLIVHLSPDRVSTCEWAGSLPEPALMLWRLLKSRDPMGRPPWLVLMPSVLEEGCYNDYT